MAVDVYQSDMNDAVRNITLTVRVVGQRRFGVKLWVSRQLLKLAAWVSGMGIKFEDYPYSKSDISGASNGSAR